MRTHLGLLFLWKRALMRRRESWSRDQLLDYQARRLKKLREYAWAHSQFYRTFHRGLERAPLTELPVLTKSQLIDHFDDIVTDRRITMRALDDHVARHRPGTRFRHQYWVCATSGTSGRHAVFPYGFSEWATVLASHSRVNDWAGVHWKLPRRLRIGIVGAQSRWHQSAAAPHSLRSLFVAINQMSPADPLQEISARLSATDPDVLLTLAGMVPALAEEARSARLRIEPQAVISVAELLTPAARRLIRETWNVEPYDMYATTEAAGMAAECGCHEGLHFFEDLIIPEVVDERNRPVPTGTPGAKVLVTVLYSRTVPLIRYQLEDSVTLNAGNCPCGRPFQRLSRVEGRIAETLRFDRGDATAAVLHPVRFGSIFDTLELKGWQVVRRPHRLIVFVLRPVADNVLEQVRWRTEQLLHELGIEGIALDLQVVAEIPRHGSGKVILVKDESQVSEPLDAPD
jgi:phenylacetate-CoA ligase